MHPRRQRLIRTSLPIAPRLKNPRGPPLQPPQPSPATKQEAEEDHHDPKRQARIQRRRERHCVLGPPARCAPAQVGVEEEADEGPDGEVEARGRWDPAQAAEEDGKVDFAPEVVAAAADEPDEDRGDETDWEGPDERSVEGAFAEETVRADDAPEDAAVEVHAGDGACEAVDGFRGADVGDVGEHPIQDADLDEAGDEGGGDLDFEEEFRRNLHVVA